MSRPVTDAMLRALRDAADTAAMSPWNYGSSTIARLKRDGLVRGRKEGGCTLYEITDAGRATLVAGR